MRSRAVHLVVLLLLLSSVASAEACTSGVERARTPGGVFVRNMLLQAAVEDAEPAGTGLQGSSLREIVFTARPLPIDVHAARGATAQAVLMHSVTGSSL